MKHFDIIGYTYEADCYCDSCAAERFGRCACDQNDVHGIDCAGNEVNPIFAGDEHKGTIRCGACGEVIYEEAA